MENQEKEQQSATSTMPDMGEKLSDRVKDFFQSLRKDYPDDLVLISVVGLVHRDDNGDEKGMSVVNSLHGQGTNIVEAIKAAMKTNKNLHNLAKIAIHEFEIERMVGAILSELSVDTKIEP